MILFIVLSFKHFGKTKGLHLLGITIVLYRLVK